MKHKHKWFCVVKSGTDGIFKCACGLLKEVEKDEIKYSKCEKGEKDINWMRILETLDRRKSMD